MVGNAWLEPFFIYRREIWNSEFLSIFSSRALKLRLYSVLYYKEVISGVKCIVLRKYPQNYFIKSKLYTGKLIKVFNQYVKWKNLEYQYIYIYFLIGVVNEVGVFAHPFSLRKCHFKNTSIFRYIFFFLKYWTWTISI